MNESLTAEIRSRAQQLGISKIGIAAAGPLAEEGKRLAEWLDRGYHGTMGWMARSPERRGDPALVLPGVRSVVSAALNYYTGASHAGKEGAGKISRYAWGDDYHDVLTPKLEALLGFILGRVPGSEGRVYVDTGPVLEKVWAQRAGIGWEGKHTNVITREYGSWVFLGEILLTAELEPDAPATDHCGSCTLCIEACPTRAIVEPYVLDSNLCISYLTIEHRGDLPAAMEGELHDWIYGCDICQDVCPWNRKFARQTEESAFAPRNGRTERDLAAVEGMSQEEFSREFSGSPVKRAKLEGLRRNAAAVRHNNVIE